MHNRFNAVPSTQRRDLFYAIHFLVMRPARKRTGSLSSPSLHLHTPAANRVLQTWTGGWTKRNIIHSSRDDLHAVKVGPRLEKAVTVTLQQCQLAQVESDTASMRRTKSVLGPKNLLVFLFLGSIIFLAQPQCHFFYLFK